MAGGLFQLAAYGSENEYLNGNPQISFFRMVYRRYTNFAMQSMEVNFENITNLSYDKTTTIRTRIPRNGDLFSHMFLCIDIPDIYADSQNKFKWTKRLGVSMINTVKISIGGTLIEQLYGEYIDIVHELKMSDEKNKCYNELIGNTPEYYEPIVEDKRYPKSSFNKLYDVSDNEYFLTKRFVNRDYYSKPSILGKKLRIPLPFWFNRNIGLSVPLIALQYHDVVVEVEFKPIRDLYVVGKQEIIELEQPYYLATAGNFSAPVEINNKVARYKWERPSNPEDEIKNFTKLNDNSWNFNPTLDINYIYLDEDERKIFAQNTQQYLIEKVTRYETIGNVGNKIIQIEAYHPVKEIYFIARRDDVKKRNEWTNYTNHDWEGMPVYEHQSYYYKVSKQLNPENPFLPLGMFRTDQFRTTDVWLYAFDQPDISGGIYLAAKNIIDPASDDLFVPYEDAYTNETITQFLYNWRYRNLDQIPVIDVNNYKDFDNRIVKNIEIKFNGNTRLESKPYDYFHNQQPYIHHNNIPREGIMIYSFAIEPEAYQPSGACNFSHVQKLEFNIEFKDLISTELAPYNNVKYDMDFYFISYNIFQVMGGMGSLVFGN